MKIEIELYTEQEDESVVMQNVSTITKHAKELGFSLGEIEFKWSEHHHKKKENENNSSDKD